MNKIAKRAGALLLAGVLLLGNAFPAFAEGSMLGTPYVSLGADLNTSERAEVLKLLGLKEDELAQYTTAKITNAEEHEYLDSYLDKSVIGSRALSSVLVRGREDGYGIKVTTKNISYCTVGMYQNALATAGIKNADITVAGPFRISGTAGLVGAIKSYENMTGQKLSREEIDAATNELVVTSKLGEVLDDSETAEELVGFIKNEVIANDLSAEEIDTLITQAADHYNIELTDGDRAKISGLMDSIKGLDLNPAELKEQIGSLYQKFKDSGVMDKLNTEETRSFLSKLLDDIAAFLKNLLN